MEVISSFEPEGNAAATKNEIWNRLSCAGFLMLVAVVVPVASYYGFMKPKEELNSAWLMRSGAMVTMAALIAEHTLAEALPRLTNSLSKFAKPISFMRKLVAIQILAGTAIWGYGDRIFY